MAANTPPKPHTEGMEWTNTKTGIKYQFSGGGWRAVSSEASEEVAEAINNIDLQKVLDNGNVADKALAIQTDNGVSVLEDQALRITHKNNPYIRLVDEADFDSMELSLQSDHAHIDLSSSDDELHFKFAGTEKITFTNTEAKFQEQVIIHTPSNVEQPFIIKGTSFTGTANSNVLFAQNVSSPASRTAIRYRGIIDNDYDLANKKYVDDQASTPEFHRLMWDPTIRDFNGYKENQPASVGQFCSMTGAASGVVWYYISDTDLDGRIIRLPTATTTTSPKGFEIEIYFQRDVSDYLKTITPDVYADGKEYKKRLCIQQNKRPTGAVAGTLVAFPWFEANASEAANFDNEVWQGKREIFIKVK